MKVALGKQTRSEPKDVIEYDRRFLLASLNDFERTTFSKMTWEEKVTLVSKRRLQPVNYFIYRDEMIKKYDKR